MPHSRRTPWALAGLLLLISPAVRSDTPVIDIVENGYVELMYLPAFAHVARTADAAQLRILRNTVDAQYGRPFRSADLQAHFGNFDWYSADLKYGDSALTQYDRFLIAFILKLEGADWVSFMTDDDWAAIVNETVQFHSTPPPVPATSCPCYFFDPDGSLRYNSGSDEDRSSFQGAWRMSGALMEILVEQTNEQGEWVKLSSGPQNWIATGDLRELSFPGHVSDYYDYMGFPIPAAFPLHRLAYEGGEVVRRRTEPFYSFDFLLGGW